MSSTESSDNSDRLAKSVVSYFWAFADDDPQARRALRSACLNSFVDDKPLTNNPVEMVAAAVEYVCGGEGGWDPCYELAIKAGLMFLTQKHKCPMPSRKTLQCLKDIVDSETGEGSSIGDWFRANFAAAG